MSIVKGLFLILFLVLLVKYIKLVISYKNQQEYFFKTLSHDFRVATLAQIRALELLQKTFPQSDLVRDINDSCKYTLEMITLLMNIYRFEQGENVLQCTKFDMSNQIQYVDSLLENLKQEKNIQIYNCVPKNLMVYADNDSIIKVLKYILSTSIFYSDVNSVITIKVKKLIDNVQISILYQGKSLTEEECRRMFYKNPRFSTVGHGIKMHYCKKIIEFHNGRIFVNNCGKNLNCFTLTLPNLTNETTTKTPLVQHLQLTNQS